MAGFGEQNGGKGIKGELNKQRIGEVLHRSGTNHYIKGDLKHAEEDYRQAIIIGYTNHVTYSNLGQFVKEVEELKRQCLCSRKQ